jgi:imidazolonepropionase-like amidohydrolase
LIQYAPKAWRDQTWPMFVRSILEEMDTDPLPVRKQFFQMELDMTLAMFRAGVPFMAGTDTAAGVHIFPGFSLHDELGWFVRAGLTPMQALQTATRNPAQFMGRLTDLGTVQKGKLADLVLLDANPLEDIANTKRIRAVILAGRYIGRADLDRMLKRAAQAAATG